MKTTPTIAAAVLATAIAVSGLAIAGCNVTVGQPQPASPPATASAASQAATPASLASPAVNTAACTQVGGTVAQDLNGHPICTNIPYLGPDDQTYYTGTRFAPDGSLAGPADTAGTTATRSECEQGYYPEYQGIGPRHAAHGRWDALLQVCLP